MKRQDMAEPSRMHEVRQNEAGDVERVQRDELPFAQPPAAAPQTRTRGTTVRKPSNARFGDVATTGPAEAEPQRALKELAGGLAPPTAGDIRLCGQVVDPAGRPVAAARVVMPRSGRSAASDSSGRFCLWAPPGDHELSVMAVGFEASRQQVHVGGDLAEARVTVKPISVLGDGGFALGGGRSDERNFNLLRGSAKSDVSGPAPAGSSVPLAARPLVAEAHRLSGIAATRSTATAFDSAAAAWERAIDRIPAGPAQIAARARLAEARYRAWSAGRTPQRRSAAIQALESYVERAPAGPERDQAARWLEEIAK
jgi:hypothetical protein